MYLRCQTTIGSLSKSDISTAALLITTSGCGVKNNQPTCENQNPLLAS